MRPLIQRPAFIEAHRFESFSERGTDVDVVLDLMIHDLDLVLSFNPGPVEEVRAAGVPVLSSTIDITNATYSVPERLCRQPDGESSRSRKCDGCRLFQRDSYVSIDFQSRQGMVGRRSAGEHQRPSIELEQFKGTDEEPLKLQLESFLHAVLTGTRPVVSGEDGAAALDLGHHVLKAIDSFSHQVQKEG